MLDGLAPTGQPDGCARRIEDLFDARSS